MALTGLGGVTIMASVLIFVSYRCQNAQQIGYKYSHMKQPEYTEGPETLENLKRLAIAILQAPAKKQKRQTKKSAS